LIKILFIIPTGRSILLR